MRPRNLALIPVIGDEDVDKDTQEASHNCAERYAAGQRDGRTHIQCGTQRERNCCTERTTG